MTHALYADYLFGTQRSGSRHARSGATRSCQLLALELDPESPMRTHPGLVAATHDYDWDEAARRFASATSQRCHLALSRMRLGCAFCLSSGRLHDGGEDWISAAQGDPLI